MRIPPFPRHRAPILAAPGLGKIEQGILDALRNAKVGGNFWAPPVQLPAERKIVVCTSHNTRGAQLRDIILAKGLSERITTLGLITGLGTTPAVPASANLWDICKDAELVITDADHEVALIAALCKTPTIIVGSGRFAELTDRTNLNDIVEREVCTTWLYRNPFTGASMSALETIDLLQGWRKMIESNRSFAEIHGVAKWKQVTTDALLWDGSKTVRHAHKAGPVKSGKRVLSWISRSSPAAIKTFQERGVHIGEIEDGMIRSSGLGANCVPPLSIVVDALGPHFDPAQASELENILQTADISPAQISRAQKLRETLVLNGISKYDQDSSHTPTARAKDKRQVLVTGQVEDDRSVLHGGCGLNNLELLRRARALEPQSHIIFKPHPDVESGHRTGHIPDHLALTLADTIDRTSSIASLLEGVDAVHVLTSLAGFEALMRNCEVITHGIPFYAGWGLTRDMGPVPERRSRQRSIDELIAATLLLYPRYLDPVTRLPCEAEILVERIASGQSQVSSPLIRLRETQGKLKRWLARGQN